MEFKNQPRNAVKASSEVSQWIVAAAVIGTSFLWYPVLAVTSVIAFVFGLGIWALRKAWQWYDSCYPAGQIPSKGVMGGREVLQQPLRSTPSFRLVVHNQHQVGTPVFQTDAERMRKYEEREYYSYGA